MCERYARESCAPAPGRGAGGGRDAHTGMAGSTEEALHHYAIHQEYKHIRDVEQACTSTVCIDCLVGQTTVGSAVDRYL